MRKKREIRKNLMKNMLWNFIAFTIIFSIFDFMIYNQVSSSLYQSIDQELQMAKEQSARQEGIKEQIQNHKVEAEPQRFNKVPENIDKKINPRLITIQRDEQGNITNQESIGRFYEEYIQDIAFDSNYLEQIYALSVNGNYHYRGYNFESTDTKENKVYIQVLANVDGETQTLNNILNTLFLGTGIIIILALIASYLLSKKAIKPIVESWEKQTEFVQNASHELRTPLTIIQAKQELLLQEPNSKIIEQSENIHQSLKETRRLSKLIKELMILARSDADQYPLTKELTDVDKVIKEVCIPYMDFANAQEKQVNLNLQFGKEIKIDRNKISQLCIIILDNSIKYTSQQDKITISTYAKDGKFHLEIADTGIGISQEAMQHIFDRFYREDKARSRETGGTGLGLSIAKAIVTAHGGTIKVVKNEPKGTKIMIRI